MHRRDREQALAKTAIALMEECGVAPVPGNFELFYAYVSSENPDIAHVIGAMIAAKKPFTLNILSDLRLRHISGARGAETVEHFGAGISQVIAGVLGKLEDAGRDALDYTKTLSAASGELGGLHSPADMRKLVESLMAATRAMGDRAQTLEGELQKSSAEVNELNSKLADVRKESLTDPLTGIANRKAFDTAMETAMRRNDGEPVSLLLCDIDNFKKFNDSWGHQTGDQVLRLVANCLADNVKGHDTAARYGGEEFTVLLRGTGLADAACLADRIRATVEARKLVKRSTGDVLGTITISIGVAQLDAGDTAEALIRRADSCLYGAKQHGRNLVVTQSDPRMAALEVSAA